jgi:hypothetical protein
MNRRQIISLKPLNSNQFNKKNKRINDLVNALKPYAPKIDINEIQYTPDYIQIKTDISGADFVNEISKIIDNFEGKHHIINDKVWIFIEIPKAYSLFVHGVVKIVIGLVLLYCHHFIFDILRLVWG